jgi:hypothetical protein
MQVLPGTQVLESCTAADVYVNLPGLQPAGQCIRLGHGSAPGRPTGNGFQGSGYTVGQSFGATEPLGP